MKQRVRKYSAARLGDYEVHTSPLGFSSIRQISSGEVMHSVNAPADEAQKLYVEQSCLAERLIPIKTPMEELVIWDVGLGAATNAMAAVRCFERQYEQQQDAIRPLRILSFECDLDSLRLAAKDSVRFPHMQHRAPHALLKTGAWNHASGRLHWELLDGDFLELLEGAAAPDLIFYDPFSYKADAGLWTAAAFTHIFAKCSEKSAELYTYSASTAVRVALLTAGFFVAEGVGIGPKSTTTIAFSIATGAAEHPLAPALLGDAWLTRWRRSDSKVPVGVTGDHRLWVEQRIETHSQFEH